MQGATMQRSFRGRAAMFCAFVLVAMASLSLLKPRPTVPTPTHSIKKLQKMLLKNFDPSLRKVWTCKQENRDTVVIFVHVFKAAGSSMRQLFRRYADSCRAACATLIHCSGLSSNSTLQPDAAWKNGFGREKGKFCVLKSGQFRNGTAMQEHQTTTSRYLRKNVDLLIGHLPVGTHTTWSNKSTDGKSNGQYLTFVRDPIQKYVSGVLFTTKDKHLSFNDTLNLIRDRVSTARKADQYYEGYTAYLSSPRDKYVGSGRQIEDRVQTVLQNLVNYPFIVGSVESMFESLQMIQYSIDGSKEVTKLFEDFGMTRETGKETQRANESRFSTVEIIEALRQHTTFWPQLEEYLKYDRIIFDFGTKIHQEQYKWFMSQK